MKITIPVKPYDPAEYGKPYIATLDFSSGSSKPETTWGDLSGGLRGKPGVLSIAVAPFDVLMVGQKGKRVAKSPSYFVVSRDGETLIPASGRNDARTLSEGFKQQHGIPA